MTTMRCPFCETTLDKHPERLCSPGVVRELRAELATHEAATAEYQRQISYLRDDVKQAEAERDALIDEVKTLQSDLDKFGEAQKTWLQFRRERDTLKAAIQFLYARQVHDGPGIRLDGQRCRGRSADALAWYGAGMRDEPHADEYPIDEADLTACERTLAMAPGPIAERMRPILDRYVAALDGES